MATDSSAPLPPQPPRLVILAGSGRLPVAIAECARAQGRPVDIVAIGEPPAPELQIYPHTHVPWGAISKLIRALRGDAPQPRDMVIAGAVQRPRLGALRPDFGLLTSLPTALSLLRGGDDAVLTRAVKFFEAQGMHVRGVQDVAPELVIGGIALGGCDPRRDAAWPRGEPAYALRVLDALGDLDIGQAIVVDGARVLGIEGAEGTDRLLDRVAALAARDPSARSGILVKAPKPGQELRVDLPSIGPETVRRVGAARLAGIVVASGLTIGMDQDVMHERADALGVFVVGLDLSQRQQRDAARFAAFKDDAQRGRDHLMRLGLSKPQAADGWRALETTRRLAEFNTGHAAVAVGRHVLSVSAAEGPLPAIVRTKDVRQWGIERLKRGAVALRYDATADGAVHILRDALTAVADLGLAAVVADGSWPALAQEAGRAQARHLRLALVFTDGAL